MRTSPDASESSHAGPTLPWWDRQVGDTGLVLVVEDDDSIRQLFHVVLADAGYTVEEAADGCEARDKLQALVPDVAVLDLTLPCVDGETLCRWLRDDERTAAIPVVCVSGHAAWDLEERLLDLGCEYLLKPCLPCDLLAAVRRARRRPGGDVLRPGRYVG